MAQTTHAPSPWGTALGTMVRLEWIGAELNHWQRWVSLVVYPVTYLGLLGVGLQTLVGDSDYLTFIVPGVIVMQAISGISRVVARTVTERRWGLAALKLQAGVPRSAYLIGAMTPPVATYLCQCVLVLAMAHLMGVRTTPGAALAMLLAAGMSALLWGCVSYSVAASITSYQTRDFILSMTILPLSFAAPVFYPLDNLPAVLRAIARVNPLTYQVEVVRGIQQGSLPGVATAVFIVLTLAALVAAILTTERMRRLSFEA